MDLSWKTDLISGKVQIKLHTDKFPDALKKEFVKRLNLLGVAIQGRIQRNISQSGSSPSAPGEFPHAVTSRLRNSIFFRVDPVGPSLLLGTNAKHGLALEFGTGPFTIMPRNAPMLSWIGRDGHRHFAYRVNHPGIAARPFIRRTVQE